MNNNYISGLLERRGIAVSKVKLSVLDRRNGEKSETMIYCFGDAFNAEHARRDLDNVGYSLISAEIADTVYGDFSLEKIYEAFAAARTEGGAA